MSARYAVDTPTVCAVETVLTLNNAGSANGCEGSFQGIVFSDCDMGLNANQPTRTLVINGTSFGPYHAGAAMPASVMITFNGSPVTFDLRGGFQNPNIKTTSAFQGLIPIVSTFAATDMCGKSATMDATINLVSTPPVSKPTATKDNTVDAVTSRWKLSGSASVFGACCAQTALTYQWAIFKADGSTPAVLMTDYSIVSGSLTSENLTLTNNSGGDNLIARLTVNNGCATHSADVTLSSVAVAIVGAAINTTNGLAVVVGNDGSKVGSTNIEGDLAWKYDMIAYVLKDDGTPFGELFRFTGVAPGSTFTPDFSNSFVTNSTDQAAVAAAITSKQVGNLAANSFVVNDKVLYETLTGGGTTKNCYFDYGTNLKVRYHYTKVASAAIASTNTNAVVNDVDRYTPGRIAVGLGLQYDNVKDEIYIAANHPEGITRIRKTPDGYFDYRTFRGATQLGAIPGAEISRFFLDLNDRANGFPKIYYANGENSPADFWVGVRSAAGNCINESDAWTWTKLLTGLSASNQSDTIWKWPDNSRYKVPGSQQTFLRAGQFTTIISVIVEQPAGTWAVSDLNFGANPPASGTIPSTGEIRGLKHDPSSNWIYAVAAQQLFRMRLGNPLTDDPRTEGNWTVQHLISVNGSGNTLGTGDVAQFSLSRGIFVDTVNTVNGEPTIFMSDQNNHYIKKIVANQASPTLPAHWTVSNHSGNGIAGGVVGTPGQVARPLLDSNDRTIAGMTDAGLIPTSNVLVPGGNQQSGVFFMNPQTGELKLLVPASTVRTTSGQSEIY